MKEKEKKKEKKHNKQIKTKTKKKQKQKTKKQQQQQTHTYTYTKYTNTYNISPYKMNRVWITKNYVLCDSGFYGRNIIQGHLILLNLFLSKERR